MSGNVVPISDLGGLDPGDYTGVIYDLDLVKQPSGSLEMLSFSNKGKPFVRLMINVGESGNIKTDLYLGRLKWFSDMAKMDIRTFAKPVKGGNAEIQFEAFKGIEVNIEAKNEEYEAADKTKKTFLKYNITPTGKVVSAKELKELQEHSKPAEKEDDSPF